MGELDYALCLLVPRQLHKAHSSFCHHRNRSVEDCICYIVKLPVQVTLVNTSAFYSLDPALFPALIPRSASYSSGFIPILWRIYGQIILRDLIWGFIGIMLTGGACTLQIGDDHGDLTLWGVTFEV